MIFKQLQSGVKVTDKTFDAVYPKFIRDLSEIYFTPVNVAKVAAKFLANQVNAKILDIGSGSGKFCMIGASYTTGHFTGVEQREHLCQLSTEISQLYQLPNIRFIHANLTTIDFNAFNGFYLFNPFSENFAIVGMIADETDLQSILYHQYTDHVRSALEDMPVGTRLATFFSTCREVPPTYRVQAEHFEGKLKLMVKA